MLEIRAGTGGEEASLFAAELFRMYSRYAETPGLEGRGAERQRHRPRRLQGSDRADRRAGRLQQAQVRGRRAPRAARAGDRRRRGASTPRRSPSPCCPRPRRSRSTSTRRGAAHRRLPLLRPRRAERQHHRLRGARHPPADRPGGRLPGREVAAQEQGEGAEDPARPPARARPGRAGRRRWPRAAAAWSAAATAPSASAPTTSRRAGSPTTASTSPSTASTASSRARSSR